MRISIVNKTRQQRDIDAGALETRRYPEGSRTTARIFRRLLFLRENPLPAAPLYRHLVFRGVECKDCRTLDLEFILGRRFANSMRKPRG